MVWSSMRGHETPRPSPLLHPRRHLLSGSRVRFLHLVDLAGVARTRARPAERFGGGRLGVRRWVGWSLFAGRARR